MNYKGIKEILKYDKHIEEHNIEQLAARLLFDLTRNTGFEVSKGKLGDVGSNHVVIGRDVGKMIFVDLITAGCPYMIK